MQTNLYNNKKMPTEKTPKFLGVTFDSFMTFFKHSEDVVRRVNNITKVLKALSGITWGKNKETIEATYKAIGCPLIDYATSVWCPSISETQWMKLPPAQNAALRVATDCHSITPAEHQEVKMLPVRHHCALLTHQFLLRSKLPGHANHAVRSGSGNRSGAT